ncbi:MAG TPA: hypothetical protein PLG56_08510 [Lacunisphaera sp.]|nr:hypothetical protein [Lacunisphaera sp.]
MSASAKSNVDELRPTVLALEALGFRLVSFQGFAATFQKEETRLRIVNDRGYWCVDGDGEELKRFPMRKTRSRATKDAIEWIKKKPA